VQDEEFGGGGKKNGGHEFPVGCHRPVDFPVTWAKKNWAHGQKKNPKDQSSGENEYCRGPLIQRAAEDGLKGERPSVPGREKGMLRIAAGDLTLSLSKRFAGARAMCATERESGWGVYRYSRMINLEKNEDKEGRVLGETLGPRFHLNQKKFLGSRKKKYLFRRQAGSIS